MQCQVINLKTSVSPLSLFFLSLHSRLKEIDMSEYDAATYERFSNAVRRQVQSLRIILDTLQVSSLYTWSSTLWTKAQLREFRHRQLSVSLFLS